MSSLIEDIFRFGTFDRVTSDMAMSEKISNLLVKVAQRVKNAPGKKKKAKPAKLNLKLPAAAKEKPFKNPVKNKAVKNFKNSKKRY